MDLALTHPTLLLHPSLHHQQMAISILVVNPNSSASMTAALAPLLHSLRLPSVTYTFFTAQPPSPASLDDVAAVELSAVVSLPHLLPLLPDHDGFIIACYSEHPLVSLLRAETHKPVLGIFEASVTQALLLLQPGERFGIVTTGRQWEPVLAGAVARFLGGAERCAGVCGVGVSAGGLGGEGVGGRLKEAVGRLCDKGGVRVVCLGCAGMAGMGEAVKEAAREVGGEVRVVDGLRAAAVDVVGLIRCAGSGDQE